MMPIVVQDELVIFFTIDQTYLIPCAATIASLMNEHPTTPLKIYFVVTDQNSSWLEPLLRMVEERGKTAEVKKVESSKFDRLKQNLHFSGANYFRLQAAELFEESKIIYMDSDILVIGNLVPLWNLHLGDFPLAAVADPMVRDFHRLNLNPEQGYFNSGLMVLNLNQWRKMDLGKKVLKYIQEFPHCIHFADQCGLNAELRGNWLRLHPKWNVQSVMCIKKEWKNMETIFEPSELMEAVAKPSIIHFTGVYKPWNLGSKHPYTKLFWLTLNQTSFKRRLPLNFSLINLIKSLFPRVLKKKYWRFLTN